MQQFGATVLPWFFKDLVIGREYPFEGRSLAEFVTAVRQAVERDWQPAESTWVN